MLLMSIIIGGGCAYWFSRHGGELMSSATKAEREGLVAAKSTDEEGCTKATEARMERDGTIRGAMGSGLYMDGCLRGARITPGFCDGVPSADEFAASTAWTRARCQAQALNPAAGTRCQVIAQGIQRFCQRQEKTDPDSAIAKLDAREKDWAKNRKR